MNDYPFVRCLNPRKIKNPYTGESMIVPCGKCDACALEKSNYYSKLCDLEEQNNKFCFFVTLTYNNSYIPTLIPRINYDSSGVPYYTLHIKDGQIDRFQDKYFEGDTYIDENFEPVRYYNTAQIERLRTKANLPNRGIPVTSKIDAQKFLKRLRFHLSKETEEKIRFLLVSEYGPVHFRSHMHLCIYFNEWSTFNAFPKALRKAWNKSKNGFYRYRLSNRDSGDYCASYINSHTSAPKLLKEKAFRGFVLHSTFFGATRILEDKEAIYAQGFDYFAQNHLELFGKEKPVPLLRSVIGYLFPKCRGFNDKSDSELYQIYTLYSRARREFKEDNVGELAKMIYCFPDREKNNYGDYLLEVKRFCDNEDKRLEFAFCDDYLSCIERDLYISKHFHQYCCNGRMCAWNIMIKIIKAFHEDMKKKVTWYWYRFREQDEFNIPNNFWFDNFVSDDDYEDRYDELNQEYFKLYRPHSCIAFTRPVSPNPFEQVEIWDNNEYYRRYRVDVHDQCDKRIKHKKLNDKNKIFFID